MFVNFWKFNVNNNFLCGNIIDCLIFRYIFGVIFLKKYVIDYVSIFYFIIMCVGIFIFIFIGVLCCVVFVMVCGWVFIGRICVGW